MGRSKVWTVGMAAALAAGALAAAGTPSGAAPGRSGAPGAPGQAAPTPVPALVDEGRAVPAAQRSSRATAAREAEVDADLLVAGRPTRLAVDLVGRTVEVELTAGPSGADGWSAWSGTVVGEPDSTVALARRGSDVAAAITTPEGAYRIRNVGPGEHVSERLGPFVEQPDVRPPSAADRLAVAAAEPSSAPAPGSGPPADRTPPVAADVLVDPVVEVLVGYTPGALAEAGSLSALNSEAALAISSTNAAYAASGVSATLHLAGTYAVGTDLDLSSESLDQLTSPTDGVADGVHARRNAVAADLVSVLVADSGSCGLAWLRENEDGTDAPWAFSLVDLSCAVGNQSFAHELGHNMGLNHDHFTVEEGGELYPYAYGHVDVANGWRTIMAYNDQCAAQRPDGYCQRLGRFSNPDQTYGGAALGRPHTGSDPADNRRALNRSLPSLSVYRSTPAPFTSWTRFVAQQFRDFNGRTPTSAESSTDVAKLLNGVTSPAAYVDAKAHGAFATSYGPVARLYFAYFLRAPDKGGLDYWVNRYRAGTRLAVVSSNFAGSGEFRTKYGSLTNRAFVELVFENVLGRDGDPGGISYWTGQLDRRVKTRGEVMVGFSESTEFKRVRAEELDVVLLYRALLQRGATPAEFADQVARLESGTTLHRLILELLDSSAYRARITA